MSFKSTSPMPRTNFAACCAPMSQPKVHNALLMFRFILKDSFLNLGYPHSRAADCRLSKSHATLNCDFEPRFLPNTEGFNDATCLSAAVTCDVAVPWKRSLVALSPQQIHARGSAITSQSGERPVAVDQEVEGEERQVGRLPRSLAQRARELHGYLGRELNHDLRPGASCARVDARAHVSIGDSRQSFVEAFRGFSPDGAHGRGCIASAPATPSERAVGRSGQQQAQDFPLGKGRFGAQRNLQIGSGPAGIRVDPVAIRVLRIPARRSDDGRIAGVAGEGDGAAFDFELFPGNVELAARDVDLPLDRQWITQHQL